VVVVAAEEYERLRRLDRAQASSFAELLLAIPRRRIPATSGASAGLGTLMYLIDTVVLSGLRKLQRDARLSAWVEWQRTPDLFVSV